MLCYNSWDGLHVPKVAFCAFLAATCNRAEFYHYLLALFMVRAGFIVVCKGESGFGRMICVTCYPSRLYYSIYNQKKGNQTCRILMPNRGTGDWPIFRNRIRCLLCCFKIDCDRSNDFA